MLLLQLHVGTGERVENGGHREGHQQDATQDAAERHHLARYAARHHVTVAHRRHRDHCPPVCSRDAAELLRGRHLVLDEVQEWGEECDGHAQEQQQQAELTCAAACGEAQRLKAERMPCQTHHVQDAQSPQDAQNKPDFVQIAAARARGGAVHSQGDVVGQDGHHVNQVERTTEEGQLAAVLNEAQCELERKPRHTHGLHDEDVVAHLGAFALQHVIRALSI